MKVIISMIFTCAAVFAVAQQESQYTQNQFNSNLQINPAYAGANEDASICMRYRKQWSSFDGSPSTFGLNAESKIMDKNIAAGLSVISDVVGFTKSTSADVSLASHINIAKKRVLSLGIKAGANFLNSDFSRLSNVDMSDQLYVENKRTIPFMGFGFLYHTPKVYLGFSVPRFVSFEKTTAQSKFNKAHYYLYGGTRLTLNEDIELRPGLLVKYVEAAPVEADIALEGWYKNSFAVGLAYRTSDAVNFMIKQRVKRLYIGYSYDMTITRLRKFNSGTHEILIGFEFGKKDNPDRNQNNRYF